jgi:hypothetical protein
MHYFVLQIVDHRIGQGNWVTLKYATRLQVRSTYYTLLRKTGHIVRTNCRVQQHGVVVCAAHYTRLQYVTLCAHIVVQTLSRAHSSLLPAAM